MGTKKKLTPKEITKRLNIETQISIAQLNKQTSMTLAIPESKSHKVTDVEIKDIIVSYLGYDIKILSIQRINIIGSNSIILWTIKL